MKSFHIHSTEIADSGRIPYLTMECLGHGKVLLDFQSLELDPDDVMPLVTMTARSLYEILEGKELSLLRGDGSITFRPEGDELLIIRGACGERPTRQYRVWTAEVSVAWNMLGWT